MRRERTWAGLALASTLTIAPWGCGGDSKPAVESSTAEAKVHGTVKARGKTVTGGEVVFNPANGARKDAAVRKAAIGKDGTYEITTLVGKNSVRISGPALEKDPQLGYAGLSYVVKSGDNTYDIELPPPTPK